MAKIDNVITPVQALKEQADTLGIEYPKNANEVKMNELINAHKTVGKDDESPTNATDEVSTNETKQDESTTQSEPKDADDLLKRIASLEALVRDTADPNKVKDFDKKLLDTKGFNFSIKLFPEVDKDGEETLYPISKWKSVSNYTARSGNDKDNQTIKIFYQKDGEEESKVIQLLEFTSILKRSESIRATSIKNLDGTNVHIMKETNKSTGNSYWLMKPEEDTYIVIIPYNGVKVEVLSTYLNA